MSTTTKTCVIKRTGRRATGALVDLPSGKRVRLNPTGSHVHELEPADIDVLRAWPDTVVYVREEPALQPERRSDRRIVPTETATTKAVSEPAPEPKPKDRKTGKSSAGK